MKILNFVVLIVVIAGVTSRVWAGDSDPVKKAQAIEKFKEGVVFFDDKNFNGALNAFEAAYALNPSWKLFYNIGHCQAALKYYGLAVVSFERYLAEGGDAVGESRRGEVLFELERMRKMIGDIELVAPVGLDVYVDNIHRGVTPLPGVLAISAGLVHRIEIREGDVVLHSTERIVRGGSSSRIVFSGDSQDTTQDGGDSSADTTAGIVVTPMRGGGKNKRKLSPAPFFIASGATVLLGGGTIALAAFVHNKKDDVAIQSDADTLNTLRKVGIGTLLGTVGCGITAIVLAFVTDFKGERKASPVSFYGTPTEGGIVLSGRF